MGHRKNINSSLFIEVEKVGSSTKWMKEKVGYQSVGAEYVADQNNSLILQLVLRQFHHLIFALSGKF